MVLGLVVYGLCKCLLFLFFVSQGPGWRGNMQDLEYFVYRDTVERIHVVRLVCILGVTILDIIAVEEFIKIFSMTSKLFT